MSGRSWRPLSAAVTSAVGAVMFLVVGPADAGTGEPPSPCLLAPVAAPVRDPFRAPGCQWCPGNRGIEYATAPGTPVRASATGTVSFAGTVAGTRYVVVEHPSGLRTTYGGLGADAVGRGQAVAAGTLVGTATDRLHFGVRRGEAYLDPGRYLARRRFRTRLVPLNGPRRPATEAGWTCPALQGAAAAASR